ncbi:acyl-CoA thioester hydrolase YciA [uncultured Thiothrix sp.]|uniref:acyl-CoA thioester hydrolase YciA n=1 Tax=uncultured Thiothrix sp. TaxID=223185 RepID=UPI00262510F7|nr:acyl-CoA thioester hydrolase YciA [uncultured Thiothrix sp.]HMT93235.1 acyl-CoA thioester hydrolase YciA [Thiolinea sp.]
MDETQDLQPKGHLLLRTVAMPADTNPNGDIFGGWIMAQMDISGGIMAKELAQGRVATIAVNAMKFIRPVKVGDVVACYGSLVHTGTTSLTIHLQTWVKPAWRDPESDLFQVTEADFVYVAIDEQGKKRALRKPAQAD